MVIGHISICGLAKTCTYAHSQTTHRMEAMGRCFILVRTGQNVKPPMQINKVNQSECML